MVKCPRGTPSQVKVNLAYINRSSIGNNGEFAKGSLGEESGVLAAESEESELDSIRAHKRSPPTARDELVYFFISSFLDILMESWDGKPCVKQKLGIRSPLRNDSEEFGEDLGPCELSIVSSTADYLKDLYQKRSSNLSKEKYKKDSESTGSEYLNEEDFEPPASPDLSKTLPDEDVHFVLKNGAWYKGRVSRRLMDGEGYYFWEDGTTFQGEFEGGCATGKGRLEFPDLSTYEGGVYKAFRHGEGMFCFSDSPIMYSGQWWLGKKHGNGLIVYNDPSEGHNFYKGQWQDGVKEGFGFRQYPSGAKYIGFWSNGMRHGKGVMFWHNHDIYRGEWKEGLMHGYGEYTWNGFINKTLSYPASNTHRGYWEEGKRHGRGLFELKSGPLIETVWVNGLKEGPGAAICGNGAVIASEVLFVQDKPVVQPPDQNRSESLSMELTQKKDRLSRPSSSLAKPKPVSIPINSPVHNLHLHPHTQKLLLQLCERNIKRYLESQLESQMETVTPKTSEVIEIEPEGGDVTELQDHDPTQRMKKEENLLRNFIISNISALKRCYDCYAKLPCEKPPTFKCVLLRLFLWQMFIDGGVPSSDLSLIDIDEMLAREDYLLMQNPHDPFERIQFWQFIHILIVLSWNLYGQYVLGEIPLVEDEKLRDFLLYFRGCGCQNVLKMTLEYFIEKHLFRAKDPKGSALTSDGVSKFEESDFAPMEAMYVIYCNLGEPHSARELVTAICQNGREDDDAVPPIVRYFEKLPFYKVEGKNALTVAGELQHITGDGKFNVPEIFQLERQQTKANPRSELTCFNGLKAKRVVRCLMEVCPGIMADEFIVNMDYKLTFLEFYKTIILCTKLQLKMKALSYKRDDVLSEYRVQLEEYKRQLIEFEKLRENPVVSRKRSRQLDPSKKGKK